MLKLLEFEAILFTFTRMKFSLKLSLNLGVQLEGGGKVSYVFF